MCVLEILMLKFFFGLRDYFERFLCWLDHWLSCMLDCIHICVSHLEKLFWKAVSTPPRHLAICRASQAFFFKWNIDTSSIPGGSIEKAPISSIAPWHLLDRSSFYSWIWLFIARYLSCRRPDPRHLPRQLSRYLPIPQPSSITEGSIYFSIAILLSFLRSLSIYPQLFISQTLFFSL